MAFVVVKYTGAAYLIYLGVRALRAGTTAEGFPADAALPAIATRRIFVDGFVVALLNPKTAIFFAAFLPQFLPETTGPLQAIALGGIFVLIAAATDSCYALASGAIRPWLLRGSALRSAGRYVSGGAFIGLGVLAALTGQRAKS
jgi:threonine/homoserine/homoserine lactone efflux protein